MEILGILFAEGAERTISELATRLNVHTTTVSREVQRLADAGIVSIRSVGRTKVVSANWSASWAPELTALLDKTIGPLALLARELSAVTGIESAYVFGSWAARHSGISGPPPRDIDVVVIGKASTVKVAAAATRVARRVGVDVNPIVISSDNWASPEQGSVLDQIRTGPLVEVPIVRA